MKSRRGLSSVVGMVFAIIAIVTTVGYVTFSLNVLDSFNQSVLAKNQMMIDAGKEKFDIYSVQITNGKFNVAISNTGNLPINITRMWVQNTTTNVVDWTNSYNCHNCIVSPGSILKNIGQSMPVGANPIYSYNLKLTTSRGNSMQFSMGSPGTKPIFLQLQIIPNSVSSYNNATLLLVATNNLTSSNLLTNITPNTPVCSTTGGATFTLKSLPPPQYPYLGNGGTVMFKWVYNAVGANNTRIACTASLQNGLASNTASDTALITIPITNQITATENFTNPTNPASTGSAAGVMSNLFATFIPKASGRILISVCGDLASSVATDGAKFDIRYGTGNTPSEGVALTGTLAGTAITGTSATANAIVPACNHVQVTGLTIGTKIWIEIGKYAITGGTASFTNFNVTVVEV
jgi:hypothetical protein